MAEKLVLPYRRTEEYFAERAAKGDVKRALQLLRRAGIGNPPMPGDELPRPPLLGSVKRDDDGRDVERALVVPARPLSKNITSRSG